MAYASTKEPFPGQFASFFLFSKNRNFEPIFGTDFGPILGTWPNFWMAEKYGISCQTTPPGSQNRAWVALVSSPNLALSTLRDVGLHGVCGRGPSIAVRLRTHAGERPLGVRTVPPNAPCSWAWSGIGQICGNFNFHPKPSTP